MTHSGIIFAVCFIAVWFTNEIRAICPILFILYPFGFIVLSAYLIYSFFDGIIKIRIFKVKAVIPFTVSLATFLIVTFAPVQECKLWTEFYCFKYYRNKIVEELKEADLEPNMEYNIDLPWYLSYVSSNGKIIVEKQGDNIEVNFRFFKGILTSRSSMVVYSSKDIEEREYRVEGEYGKIEKLGDNWYYIQEQLYD